MKPSVAVISRNDVTLTCIELFASSRKACAISITGRDQKHPIYDTEPLGIMEVLKLSFHDVNADEEIEDDHMNIQFLDAMSTEQARQILQFVLKLYNEVDIIICQCDAGVSRSRAVAAALLEIMGEKQAAQLHFKKGVPNTHVYREILRVWYEEINPEHKPFEEVLI